MSLSVNLSSLSGQIASNSFRSCCFLTNSGSSRSNFWSRSSFRVWAAWCSMGWSGSFIDSCLNWSLSSGLSAWTPSRSLFLKISPAGLSLTLSKSSSSFYSTAFSYPSLLPSILSIIAFTAWSSKSTPILSNNPFKSPSPTFPSPSLSIQSNYLPINLFLYSS